jgi:DNA mismatch repair protein MutS2
MHARSLKTLEFPKIRERLAAHTAFSASRELALRLEPSNERATVRRLLAETSEARVLLTSHPGFSVRSACDVRPLVQRARLGGALEPEELLQVLGTLEAARYVKHTLTGGRERSGSSAGGDRQHRSRDSEPLASAIYPYLREIAARMSVCAAVSQAIRESIDERGEVVDSASPQLAIVRQELKRTHRELMGRLESLINSAQYRPMLQEPIITMREGRYVVPVKAEYRNQFKGIVHDESASGATLFMEPLAVLDLANEWRHLQREEQKEIERVLRRLSELVGRWGDEIDRTVVALAELDLALARAKLADAMQASAPQLSDRPELNLVQARHPLLTGKVVPIDIYLGMHRPEVSPKQYFILVITGPNTGGKTVALKTVGLLTLMAQAGLHIPAAEGSMIGLFRDVFADIGDEQSIEQSLSTFSSHMSHIVEILRLADEGCLVLLDELGAGTDPAEGAALARAILSYLWRHRIPTVATTHYSELKAYAHTHDGIENASVEFDVETLSPTYVLSIGLPGRSNALAIATRLGVPEEIIDEARQWLNPTAEQVEDLLQAIRAELEAARRAREEAERARQEAERLRRRIAEEYALIDDERRQLIDEARRQAEELVRATQEELRRIEREAVLAGAGRSAVRRALEEARTAAALAQRTVVPSPVPLVPPAEEPLANEPLRPGDPVRVRELAAREGAVGELLSPPDRSGMAEVQFGSLKMRVPAERLERASRRELRETRPAVAGPPTVTATLAAQRRAEVSAELDLRGRRAEEAIELVEKYLDDAVLGGLSQVRIIHGKGTGALRQVVRDILARHPMVQEFGSAPLNQGGDGVTVAKLAS